MIKREKNWQIKNFENEIKNIETEEQEAENKYGFKCLKNATELKYDIGESIYFNSNGMVYKGIISAINPYSMYEVMLIGDIHFAKMFIHSSRAYRNPMFALREAMHWEATKNETKYVETDLK